MSAKPATSEEAQTSELLQESEYRALYRLRYKKEDIAAMEPSLARQKITKGLYKPGTPQAIAQAAEQTGLPASAFPVDKLTDEAIEERNEGKGSTEVMVSDWYNKNSESCAHGEGTIFDKVARPIMAEFPALAFRWLDPGVVARLGSDLFERFYHPVTGKDFEVGGQYLGFKPREIAERAEKDQLDFNQAQLRSVTSEMRNASKQLEDGGYGGSFKDNVRLTRDDGRSQRL